MDRLLLTVNLHLELPNLQITKVLPGRPFWPNEGAHRALTLSRRREDYVLSPSDQGRYDNDLVGDLCVVCERPDGSFESVVVAELLPPAPFTVADIGVLRTASDELHIGLGHPVVSGARSTLTDEALRAAQSDGLDVGAVVELAEAVQALLASWPKRPIARYVALPLSVVRGVVDEPRTRRAVATGSIGAERRVPRRSIRRVAGSQDWVSGRLAVLLGQTRSRLATPLEGSGFPETLDVAGARLAPPRGSVEVPASGWPWKLHVVWDRATRVLMAPRRAPGAGADHLPLQELWRLYQDWVAQTVITEFKSALGPPATRQGKEAARWILPGGECAIWVDYSAGGTTAPVPVTDIYKAAVRPDVLIKGTRIKGSTVFDTVVVVDAKRYSTPREVGLTAGQALEMSAKYHWGIRNSAGDSVVDRVHLVAPDGPEGDFGPRARTSVAIARPGAQTALTEIVKLYAARFSS